ncbi:response regulator [Fibrobacterota bacterium]
MEAIRENTTLDNRMLMADDEDALTFAFRNLFKTRKMAIDTCSSLETARTLIDQNNYKMVLTDLRLGNSLNSDGFKLTRYAKARNPESIVILWTAHGTGDTKKNSFDAGADFYFEKPLSPGHIKNIIKNLATT